MGIYLRLARMFGEWLSKISPLGLYEKWNQGKIIKKLILVTYLRILSNIYFINICLDKIKYKKYKNNKITVKLFI